MVRAVTPIPFVKARFFDRCGKPLAGGKVYTYEANTTTQKVTYKDPYGLTPNTNPIILDAAGEADIYLDGTYRIRITDRNDVLINDVSKIGSWFSDNLQDTLDNISGAMDDALKPMLQNLDDAINAAAAAAAGANGWTATLVKDRTGKTQQQINDVTIQTVAVADDLLNIQNPIDKQVVYVKSTQKNYIYRANSTLSAIKNVVVGKWEMELQEQYLASWVATPDVQESQALALQSLYDYATSKQRPFAIDDVFWVTGIEQKTSNDRWLGGLVVPNNSEIRFIADGELKIIPSNSRWYSAISTELTTNNYRIMNPKITGDRLTHIYDAAGATHEWGECITIHVSSNGYIFKPVLRHSIGDGLYIGLPSNYEGGNLPTNITVIEPVIDACRRNGLVLAAGNNVNIERPVTTRIGVTTDGIAGTAPGSGIDFECEQNYDNPNATKAQLINCHVTSPVIKDTVTAFGTYNRNNGIEISVNVTGTTYIDNPNGGVLGICQYGAYCTGAIEFDHVLVKDFNSEVDQVFGWCGTGKSKFIINKLTLEKSKDFILRYDPMFQMSGKELGNVFFNEIVLDNANVVLFSRDTNLDTYTDNSVFKKSEYANCNMLFNRHSKIPKLGKKFLLDGIATLDASTTNQTNIYPNTMMLDPSKDLSSIMYVTLSGDDFRILKFLAPVGESHMGAGVEIRGLYIPNNGDAKTSAKTTSTDAWIVLQKQSDGTTKIIDSHGTWTFA